MSSPLFCSPASEQFAQDDRQSISSFLEFSDGESIRSHDTVPGTRFRFTKRFCILTYSQTPPDFDPSAIVRILHSSCRGCIVARESHMDGGTHYHAFVDYGTPRDWTNSRRWDVLGVHPNVKPVSRTPYNAYAYVGKDKNIIHECFTEANRPRPRGSTSNAGRNRKRAWAEIANAPNKDEFFASCKALDPRSFITCFGNVSRYADYAFPDLRRQYESPTGITIDLSGYGQLREYFSTWLEQRGRWVTPSPPPARPSLRGGPLASRFICCTRGHLGGATMLRAGVPRSGP